MPPSTDTPVAKPFPPLRWHPVGGAEDAWVFPITGKPTITNSSTYILRTPRTVVVIDPGADADQATIVADAVHEARRERERAFLLILTHAHLDHFLNVDQVIRSGGRPLSFAHADAVAAIARKDRSHTLSILYKDAVLPEWTPDVAMFANPGALAPGGFRTALRGDAEVPHVTIELDPGNTLEIYATPGHSPCSCSVRLGEFIAIGDLPFAAKPGLAGLAGWSAAALKTSLQTMSRLLSHGSITVCGPGHGNCAPAATMACTLDAVSLRLKGLGSLASLDERRVMALRSFANELLGESERLFSILGGRLLYLSHVLDHLGEAGEAARILSLLDLDAVERVLGELGIFHQAFEAGLQPELAVVLKANAVVERLQRLIADQPSLRTLCGSLLDRVEQLLGDFCQTVQGLDFEVKTELVDLLALVGLVVNGEQEARGYSTRLLAGTDDAEVFTTAITRSIASRSLLAVTSFSVVPTHTTAMMVRVNIGRFRNLLTTLLELAAVGADGSTVEIALAERAGEIEVEIRGVRDSLAASMPQQQRSLYQRMMTSLGGRMDILPDGYVLRIACCEMGQ